MAPGRLSILALTLACYMVKMTPPVEHATFLQTNEIGLWKGMKLNI